MYIGAIYILRRDPIRAHAPRTVTVAKTFLGQAAFNSRRALSMKMREQVPLSLDEGVHVAADYAPQDLVAVVGAAVLADGGHHGVVDVRARVHQLQFVRLLSLLLLHLDLDYLDGRRRRLLRLHGRRRGAAAPAPGASRRILAMPAYLFN